MLSSVYLSAWNFAQSSSDLEMSKNACLSKELYTMQTAGRVYHKPLGIIILYN